MPAWVSSHTGYTGIVNTIQKLTKGLRGKMEQEHSQGEDCYKAAELVTITLPSNSRCPVQETQRRAQGVLLVCLLTQVLM